MTFCISREQQKVFIENFMSQTLDLALQLAAEGKERGSPGETIHAIGSAIIRQLQEMQPTGDSESSNGEHN